MGDIKDKPSKYWADRQIADVKKSDAEALKAFKEMQSHYSKLEKELNNEVAYFYQKYGNDNVIEFNSLRNRADKADLDMLYQDWEGFAEKYPNYAHLKPVRENMYKLDRYEMLIEKSRYQLSELGAKEAEIMSKSLKGTARSTYSSMGKALSGNVAMLDDLQADKMIATKWISGQNYSDRVWKNKDKLLGHLDYELRNGIIRGDDFNTMTAHLRNITGVGKSDAERLIRTETSYIANKANMQNYVDNGLKFYEYLAVEDSRTSQACNGLNGQILPLDKAIIGSNYPPLHPNCRSRALPVSNRRAKELGIDANGMFNTGANSGALNPESKRASAHAEKQYNSIRKMKTDVSKIAKNTNYSIDDIQKIKNYLFMDVHDFKNNERFDADFSIAQSWTRLMSGKNIEKHDIILLQHEVEEMKLVKKGMSQYEAHNLVNKTYNYAKEADKYYANIKKHKK